MKKFFLASALVLMGAASMVAQRADRQNTNCAATPCTENIACAQTACGPRNNCMDMFQGLDLTAEQQTQIQALQTECRQQAQAQRENARASRQAAAADRQQAKRDKLARFKAILTPEQYVAFLENAFVNAGPSQGARMGNRDGSRQHGNCHAARRDNRAQRVNNSVPRQAEPAQAQ